jgi:hypothetical protein
MIFFVNSTPMHYICDIKESDFPCKFFIFNVGINTTVKMTRFIHINTYLRDIEDIARDTVYKLKTSSKFNINTFNFDDEEPELDEDLTEGFPRMVMWNTKLL